ncbi:PSP1 C-terminal conserved region-domain-containing protein [Zychaea mexicana]|uniref:PSP1 C-terminal conserved region-domain-containing protein n=1 Tax=Zychaea mexicana TaxID=64656 RepID=UPI0022FF09CC|nr:PSP1 C-terminal conserved region-domain-containing protein [Zychaea mexicana]KAI9498975.1 PSP1 C-terminal conserved region-domain-containing protein [Zychaea mexicana]
MAKQHNQSTTAQAAKSRKKESRADENNSNNTWPDNSTNDSGFQWEGPSIFDDNKNNNSNNNNNNGDHAPAHEVIPPDMIDGNSRHNMNNDIHGKDDGTNSNDVLAVPMLPGVSMEPIYRQHRSLSFSMGQDPTFFGYNDYSDDDDNIPSDTTKASTRMMPNSHTYKNSLETMTEEEDDEVDDAQNDNEDDEMEFNPCRTRSKSSGAALSMLSSSQQGYLVNRSMRRGSAGKQQDEGQVPSDQQRLCNVAASSSSGSQGHMNSATTDPVLRLAEQIEAMQLQQQQSGYNTMPTSYPMPIPPHPEMYSHPHPPAPHHHHLHHPTAAAAAAAAGTPYYPDQHHHHHHHHHPHHPQPQHNDTSTATTTTVDSRVYQEGKGVALHQLPTKTLLYMIEFKAGRTDFFYVMPNTLQPPPRLGDLVIVEADRGKDLGKVALENLTHEEILNLKKQQQQQQQHDSPSTTTTTTTEDNNEHSSHPSSSPRSSAEAAATAAAAAAAAASSSPVASATTDIKPSDIQIKRIYRQALPDEISVLMLKSQDEQRALSMCQQKTKQRNLPMEVVDAEYQWDRRKLTFYFIAERRIDFRELVRELFKIYKTRIWMCAVNPGSNVN